MPRRHARRLPRAHRRCAPRRSRPRSAGRRAHGPPYADARHRQGTHGRRSRGSPAGRASPHRPHPDTGWRARHRDHRSRARRVGALPRPSESAVADAHAGDAAELHRRTWTEPRFRSASAHTNRAKRAPNIAVSSLSESQERQDFDVLNSQSSARFPLPRASRISTVRRDARRPHIASPSG